MATDQLVLLVLAGLGAATLLGCAGAVIGASKDMALVGFLLGFFVGPIGLVVIAVLQPTRPQADRVARRQGMVQCPNCREFIRPAATVCHWCRHDTRVLEAEIDESALDREWERFNPQS